MLKGAIDFVSPTRVGGWVYAEADEIQGKVVLAFLDSECVGAGKVENYRSDLAEAGLGDGNLGFNFDIGLQEENTLSRITVKLEGSDFVLLQRDAIVVPANTAPSLSTSLPTMKSVEWMRRRGWLDQSDFDFLRLLNQFGVYDLTLKGGDTTRGSSIITSHAGELLSLIRQQDVSVELRHISISELNHESFLETLEDSIIAIHADTPGTIMIVEGSAGENSASIDGAVEYQFGPDRLLFVDLRTNFRPNATDHNATITALVNARMPYLGGPEPSV
ncbi:hypothetical protein FOZ76_06055 [Verticiella sediminum]|uniref:Uncharacterized protein n=1 Tax=Verticiella sediminum TaxID=1247510 RepID=A0A556AWH2_9BURK|nr:hypothetical protein [Verticiella sediminum]TSH97291.1 hypothetical protein FOZ76_06055 [Verticiella sediminum]